MIEISPGNAIPLLFEELIRQCRIPMETQSPGTGMARMTWIMGGLRHLSGIHETHSFRKQKAIVKECFKKILFILKDPEPKTHSFLLGDYIMKMRNDC